MPRQWVRRVAGPFVATAAVLGTAACTSDDGTAAARSTAGTSAAADGGTYLALGDSVPFGFRPGASPDEYADPGNFVGYPELVGDELGLQVVNAACPGETTASVSDVDAPNNGCTNSPGSDSGYRTGSPLHVDYDTPDQSQLDFAVATLQETDDVELVTVQLGANDGFLCQQATADRCGSGVGTLARTVQANLDTVLSTLREQGGYDGTIVVVTYYALDYSGPDAPTTQVLDGGIAAAAAANGAVVASGYDAFRPAAERAGGSSTDAGLVLPGDVHPSEQGQQLLAGAVTAAVPD